MNAPEAACHEASQIMQRMWTDGVSRLDWVCAEDQNEVNLQNELQRGFTTPNLARTAAALSRNGRRRSKVTVLDPTIGTGMLAASIIVNLAELPPAERPKSIAVIGIDRNLKYCKAARARLGDLSGWAVNHGIWVDTHVVTGDFLNPGSWTGDIAGAQHDEIRADIVIINPPHRPVRSKTREGRSITELEILPGNTTETAYIELAARTLADGGELIAVTSARWMNDEDNVQAVQRLQETGSVTDIHVYRRQNISSSRLFGRNAQYLDATAWRYQKGAAHLPARTTFHETTGPGEPRSATIHIVTPHDEVLRDTGRRQHPRTVEIPRSQLDDEIQRILRDLPKLRNGGLQVSRGRLSPYRKRERFTCEPGDRPAALITANNIVKTESGECPLWHLEWPSERPNSLHHYRADLDTSPITPIAPGRYVLVTGPPGNGYEPCPRAAVLEPGAVGIPFVVTQQMHVIGTTAHDDRVPPVAPLDEDRARGLAAWLNSRLIRSHFRMTVKSGAVTGLLATRIPTPEAALLHEIGRLARTRSDAVTTALRSRLTTAEAQAVDDNEAIEHAWETLLQKLDAGPKIANYGGAAAMAALAAHQRERRDGVDVDDLLPLIKKRFDIEFTAASQEWFEHILIPWAQSTGAARADSRNRLLLTERAMRAMTPDTYA